VFFPGVISWDFPPRHAAKLAQRQRPGIPSGKKKQGNGNHLFLNENTHTLPETNVAPQNGWLEYSFPFGMDPFSGTMLVSGRVVNKHGRFQ